MTREEINKISLFEPHCFETVEEEIWYQMGCIDGLEAADKEPNTSVLWHDASEEPIIEQTHILATNETDIIEVFHLSEGRKYNLDGYLTDWSRVVESFNLTKWAYISDLLPKGGEKWKEK